jgi:lysophospholipase L1-like esterase
MYSKFAMGSKATGWTSACWTSVCPDLVTVFTGANDIVAGVSRNSFRNDVSTILEELSRYTSARVFIATIPDLTKLPRFVNKPDRDVTVRRASAFNRVIRNQARLNGATVVDLAPQPISGEDVAIDGFHPSNEGHQLIAQLFLAAIRPTLETS